MLLPKVRNIPARSIGDDLEPYDPGNPEHVEHMEKRAEKLFNNLKDEFDRKGIPMPSVRIITERRPISEGDHPLIRKRKI